MTVLVPRQLQATRAILINGVSYAKDQVLTGAQIAAIPRLSALLSAGRLRAVPDAYGRKTVKGEHTPTHFSPTTLAELARGASLDFTATATLDISAGSADKSYILSLVGGQFPYSVDWGDSSTQVINGQVVEHTYATIGSKTITVTSENGDTATATFTVVARPVAAFTSVVTVKSVAFTNTSTNTPTSYAWDFGDGQTSTSASPTNVYAAAGSWIVTMTATNAGGHTSVAHTVVTV